MIPSLVDGCKCPQCQALAKPRPTIYYLLCNTYEASYRRWSDTENLLRRMAMLDPGFTNELLERTVDELRAQFTALNPGERLVLNDDWHVYCVL